MATRLRTGNMPPRDRWARLPLDRRMPVPDRHRGRARAR